MTHSANSRAKDLPFNLRFIYFSSLLMNAEMHGNGCITAFDFFTIYKKTDRDTILI